MDLTHLCMGCMEDKGEAERCPGCGWLEGTPPDSPVHLPPRSVLGEKYLLGRVLGQGGFGITYLAWDIYLDRKLAVKEYFPRELCYRETGYSQVSIHSGTLREQYVYGLDKFLAEGKTLARFDGHPNIVAVRDFFAANESAYLVMSYLEGVTLGEYLESRGSRIEFAEALQVIMPVLDALRAVHDTGLLHRDISPDNIMITVKRRVVVLDFGAARHALGERGKKFSVILKPGYAPEEQYRSSGSQGPWTDIYAAAATLYRAVTGRMPPDSLDRLNDDTLIPPSHLGVALAPAAEAALLKALAVRAEERFQSIAELQEALRAHAEQPETAFTGQNGARAARPAAAAGDPASSGERVEPRIPLPSAGEAAPAGMVNIGRASGNDLVLGESTVSRRHACIYRQSGKWYIADLGSTHGTFVNGVPVGEAAELAPGSRIRFSGVSVRFDGANLLSEEGELLKNLAASSIQDGRRARAADHSGPVRPRIFSPGRRKTFWAAAAVFGLLLLALAAVVLWNATGAGVPSATGDSDAAGSGTVAVEEGAAFGTIEFTGGTYTGELKDGVPHGHGTMIFAPASGSPGAARTGERKYVGQWREGKMHGEGTMTYPDGFVRSGTWENDVFIGR